MEEVIKVVPTEASRSPILYAKGEFENTKIRSGSRDVNLNLCSTATFYLDPRVVYEKISKPITGNSSFKRFSEIAEPINPKPIIPIFWIMKRSLFVNF